MEVVNRLTSEVRNSLLDDNRALEPPDPFSNSVVKRCIADGSVGSPHVRVGHCQALNTKNPDASASGFFFAWWKVWCY